MNKEQQLTSLVGRLNQTGAKFESQILSDNNNIAVITKIGRNGQVAKRYIFEYDIVKERWQNTEL